MKLLHKLPAALKCENTYKPHMLSADTGFETGVAGVGMGHNAVGSWLHPALVGPS